MPPKHGPAEPAMQASRQEAARASAARIAEAERSLPPSMRDGAGAFTGLFVRRPVLALVINLLIVVAGLAAYLGVEIRELPDIDRPVVTITTTYPGAAPATIDREITETVESAASRVPGIVTINASSRFGRSRVTVEFGSDVDIDRAAGDLRDAISRVLSDLPDEADLPEVVKADADASPVMRVSMTSETLPITEVTRLAREEVGPRIAAIEGVAEAVLRGERDEVLYIDVNQTALASRGLDLSDITRLTQTVTGETPAGRLESATQELVIRTDSRVLSAEAFAALPLDATTRLGDVAQVFFEANTRSVISRADGIPRVGIDILKQAGSNTLDISKAVRAEVDRLNQVLPDALRIFVSSDDAIFVQGAIDEVVGAIFIATLIVICVILVFLTSLRATLIPALTMPVALLGTFAGIWAAGFSINILTLLALVLATGLVVDDAIVVLENVMRRRAQGLGARAAALVGVREVFFAIISTTATLASVFVPISFLPGRAGGLFAEFGFVLAIAVSISSVVTLTLVPMLAARLLPDEGPARRRGILGRIAGAVLHGIGRGAQVVYRVLLRAALAAPLVVIVIALMISAAAWPVYESLPKEVTPPEDRALVLISVSTPQGSSLAHTDAKLRKIEAILEEYQRNGEGETVFSFAGWGGGNRGFVVLRLAHWDDRARGQGEILSELRRKLFALPGVRAFAFGSNSLGIRGGGRGLQFAVAGADYATLADTANALVAKMSEDPRFGRVRLSFDLTQPQLTVSIDRVLAGDLGIDVTGMSRALQAVLDGRTIGTLYRDDGTTDIKLVSTGTRIDDPTDLENVFLRSSDGRILPVSSVATLSEAAAPSELQREARLRAVPVTASLDDGMSIDAAMRLAEALARDILPPGVRLVPLAEAATLSETESGLWVVFATAIIVVVLVLAAQFESFLAAFIIVLTVPLGLAFAIFAMALSGGSLNVYSQIGLVLLVGVMAKNGILIVEFANQLRERGLALREAIEAASLIRLRPVVMTAISTVLGGLPLILTSGPGAEARIALGWVVVGGLGFATLATLFLTPVTYLLLARFSRPRRAETERLEAELQAAEAQS
ncbi:MAG: efflux RND transporter permease subunit [Pseudomonadota bacterium]